MPKMTFPEWLAKQTDRDDPVGDLAKDAARDPKKPMFPSLGEWQTHITCAVLEPQLALEALGQAWDEWMHLPQGVTITLAPKGPVEPVLTSKSIVLPPQAQGIKEVPLPAKGTTLHADMKRRFNNFKIESAAKDCTVYPISGKNPHPGSSLFFDTVHFCYANHHALALSPEVLAYLINYAVAIEVKQDPETYRDLFTTSPDKIKIVVEDDTLVLGGCSDWTPGVLQFERALKRQVLSDLVNTMLPAFSTETLASRVASLICVLDAASPYYDFGMRTMCGIPRIVMLGEAKDWTKLVTMVSVLEQEFPALKTFWDVLLPTVERLVLEFNAEAEGREHDRDFWGQIYKHWGGSGTNAFDGWIANFVAWIAEPDQSKMNGDTYLAPSLYIRKTPGQQIEHGTTGSNVSRVPFDWHYYDKHIPMLFAGGVLDVHVTEDLALQPRLSYAILHAK